MTTSIVMPKLGMTMTKGTIVEWLKNPGDTISKGEEIVTISSEKLTSEVEAPASGVLFKIIKEANEEVPVGEIIGIIGENIEEFSSSSIVDTTNDLHEKKEYPLSNDKEQDPFKKRFRISPAARKRAKELGVDTLQVTGTGPKGRITRRDIEKAAKEAGTTKKRLQTTRSPETETQMLSSMRSTIAKRMHKSITSTAQLTLHRKAEIDTLIKFQNNIRQEVSQNDLNVRLTLTVFLAKAVILSLKEMPIMNRHLVDNTLYQYDDIHLGIATSLDEGLVVPVVKNADKLSLGALAEAISTVTKKARNSKADPNELTGSTFTLTNLGSQGVEYFTPILNPPESGILGVGAFSEELKLINGKVVSVKRIPLSLTFDHRVLDGVPAADFLARIVYYLEHPYLLVL